MFTLPSCPDPARGRTDRNKFNYAKPAGGVGILYYYTTVFNSSCLSETELLCKMLRFFFFFFIRLDYDAETGSRNFGMTLTEKNKK